MRMLGVEERNMKKLLLATAISVASLTSALGQSADEWARQAITRQEAHFHQQANGPLDTLTSDELNARINRDNIILMSSPFGHPNYLFAKVPGRNDSPVVFADLKAAQKVLADRRTAALAEASIKRDPNDVVAQVFNYTTSGKDEGEKAVFWYKISECHYKSFISWENNLPGGARADGDAADSLVLSNWAYNESEVLLNAYDLRSQKHCLWERCNYVRRWAEIVF